MISLSLMTKNHDDAARSEASSFPPELVGVIISFVPSLDDLLPCSLVCREWARLALPRVYRRIRLRAYLSSNEIEAKYDLPGLLRCARAFSVLMRSCVKELNIQIATHVDFTLDMFSELLDFFPGAHVVEYTSPTLPRVIVDSSSASLPQGSRRTLSALRIGCDLIGEAFDAPRPIPLWETWDEDIRVSTLSMLHNFLNLFDDIELLDVIYLELESNLEDNNDSGHLRQVQTRSEPLRIQSLVTRHGKLYDLDPLSLICDLIDAKILLFIQDDCGNLNNFIASRTLDRIFPNVKHIRAGIDGHFHFLIPPTRYPALETLEFSTRIYLPTSNNLSDQYFYYRQWSTLTESLYSVPSALCDIKVYMTISGSKKAGTALRADFRLRILPKFQFIDWEVLDKFLAENRTTWKMSVVLLLDSVRCTAAQPNAESKREAQDVILNCEEMEKILRDELLAPGSWDIPLSVRYT